MIEVSIDCRPFGYNGRPVPLGTLVIREVSRANGLTDFACSLMRRRGSTPINGELLGVPTDEIDEWMLAHMALKELVPLERPPSSMGLSSLDASCFGRNTVIVAKTEDKAPIEAAAKEESLEADDP